MAWGWSDSMRHLIAILFIASVSQTAWAQNTPAPKATAKPAAAPAVAPKPTPSPAAAAKSSAPSAPASKPVENKPAAPAAANEAAKNNQAIRDQYGVLPLAERLSIQSDLVWSGDYNGTVSGEFNDRAIAA